MKKTLCHKCGHLFTQHTIRTGTAAMPIWVCP